MSKIGKGIYPLPILFCSGLLLNSSMLLAIAVDRLCGVLFVACSCVSYVHFSKEVQGIQGVVEVVDIALRYAVFEYTGIEIQQADIARG